ncbi:pirin family protein [Quatrionicoccus australiensis]|uniref:pirin family protein n=1 Tax=Quatrionicoccus australiensis TaxID=138118 RepID=UPI001CFB6BBE|nr:pirin family protein [Quatrionicoccus australiensis]MCB4361506.1 pirin family protein [Quatrionicoccus australiensis]
MSSIARITARNADLGDGMMVRRVLPSRQQRMVGAWCFLDHAGPVDFASERGMHVGAHPHIGLQTFTWLIEGEVLHRDSLGNAQIIRPGQVNLMTAGHGVVHTEDSLVDGSRLHAAQLWIALPPEAQDCPPDFAHHPELPQWSSDGTTLTLLAGNYAGHAAPTQLYSPLLGLDIASATTAAVDLDLRADFEYALLPLTGSVSLDSENFRADEFAYLGHGRETLRLELAADSKVLLLGGEPFAEPVLMWWNFVGFDKATIAAAQRQWESGDARFGVVGDGLAPRLKAPPLPWSQY